MERAPVELDGHGTFHEEVHATDPRKPNLGNDAKTGSTEGDPDQRLKPRLRPPIDPPQRCQLPGWRVPTEFVETDPSVMQRAVDARNSRPRRDRARPVEVRRSPRRAHRSMTRRAAPSARRRRPREMAGCDPRGTAIGTRVRGHERGTVRRAASPRFPGAGVRIRTPGGLPPEVPAASRSRGRGARSGRCEPEPFARARPPTPAATGSCPRRRVRGCAWSGVRRESSAPREPATPGGTTRRGPRRRWMAHHVRGSGGTPRGARVSVSRAGLS